MSWVAFAILVYLAGAGMHWWPTPLAVMTPHVRRAWVSMTSRWSGPMSDDEDEDDADVMTSGEGPTVDHGHGVYTSRPTPLVGGPRMPVGSRPLEEVRTAAGLPPTSDADPDEHLDRDDWITAKIDRGWRAGRIDAEGARKFGITPRHVARIRAMIARGDEG